MGQETPEGVRCWVVSRGRSDSVVGRALLAMPGRILLHGRRQCSLRCQHGSDEWGCACLCARVLARASVPAISIVLIASESLCPSLFPHPPRVEGGPAPSRRGLLLGPPGPLELLFLVWNPFGWKRAGWLDERMAADLEGAQHSSSASKRVIPTRLGPAVCSSSRPLCKHHRWQHSLTGSSPCAPSAFSTQHYY